MFTMIAIVIVILVIVFVIGVVITGKDYDDKTILKDDLNELVNDEKIDSEPESEESEPEEPKPEEPKETYSAFNNKVEYKTDTDSESEEVINEEDDLFDDELI